MDDPKLDADEAIRIHQGSSPPVEARAPFWLKTFGVMVANVVLTAAVFWIVNLPGKDLMIVSRLELGLFLLFGGELLGGLVLSVSGRGGGWGRGLLIGALLTLSVPLLLLGVCLALFGGGGGHSVMLLFFQGW
jgi:FtsH-binding integral membrane protein